MTARMIAAYVIPPPWVLYRYGDDIYMPSCVLLMSQELIAAQRSTGLSLRLASSHVVMNIETLSQIQKLRIHTFEMCNSLRVSGICQNCTALESSVLLSLALGHLK